MRLVTDTRNELREQVPSLLVIEDDELICDLLKVVLEYRGQAVDIADTYAEGWDAIKYTRPSAIILDLGLPDGDGLDLLRFVREDLHRSVPVLVLTAYRAEEKAVRAFQLGASDYITKPFAPNELVARIERALVA